MDLKEIHPLSWEDWEPFRPLVTELYVTKSWSLKQVQTFLKSNHNFRATEPMYKRKIKAWGLDKKHKRHEVLEILRIQSERAVEDKRSTFILRGQEVNLRDIERYVRRKKLLAHYNSKNTARDKLIDCNVAKKVSDLICRTPSPSTAITDPGNVLNATETFYLLFDRYVLSCVETGIWKPPDKSGYLQNGMSRCGGYTDVKTTIRTGISRFCDGQYSKAFCHWRIAFKQLEEVASSWNYYQMMNVISVVPELINCNVSVARIFLKHLKELVSVLPTYSNPQRSVLCSLCNLDPTNIPPLVMFARRCSLLTFRRCFAWRNENFVLAREAALAEAESNEGVWVFSSHLLQRVTDSLNLCDESDDSLMMAAEMLVVALETSNRLEEAEQLSIHRVARLQQTNSHRPGQKYRALTDLGRIQHKLEKFSDARQSLLSAAELHAELNQLWSNFHENLGWVDHVMIDIVQLLIDSNMKLGLSAEVAKHREQLRMLIFAKDEQARQQLSQHDLLSDSEHETYKKMMTKNSEI